MKKMIAMLLVLPFLVAACGDELFQVGFDYEFKSSFQLDPTEGPGDLSVRSSTINLTVLEELDERGLATLEAASLSRITLLIADESRTTWAAASDVTLYADVDGKEILIARSGEISAEAGKELELEPAASEFELMDLLGKNTAVGLLKINLKESITKETKVVALVATRLTASPE